MCTPCQEALDKWLHATKETTKDKIVAKKIKCQQPWNMAGHREARWSQRAPFMVAALVKRNKFAAVAPPPPSPFAARLPSSSPHRNEARGNDEAPFPAGTVVLMSPEQMEDQEQAKLDEVDAVADGSGDEISIARQRLRLGLL